MREIGIENLVGKTVTKVTLGRCRYMQRDNVAVIRIETSDGAALDICTQVEVDQRVYTLGSLDDIVGQVIESATSSEVYFSLWTKGEAVTVLWTDLGIDFFECQLGDQIPLLQ